MIVGKFSFLVVSKKCSVEVHKDFEKLMKTVYVYLIQQALSVIQSSAGLSNLQPAGCMWPARQFCSASEVKCCHTYLLNYRNNDTKI